MLERRIMPPKTRRMSRTERWVGPSSASGSYSVDFEVDEGFSVDLGEGDPF